MNKIERALISVSDKTGLEDFARLLAEMGLEILSTGGTAKALAGAGLKVTEVSAYTGAPEILGGRVKTLHPKIHAGILYRRGAPEHEAQMRERGFSPIDLVVVNLYPFEEAIARPGTALEEAVENIDIGGPCLLRAAAKNFDAVAAVCDPGDYPLVAAELKKNGGLALETRRRLAAKVFRRISAYDRAISDYLERFDQPNKPSSQK
jgi:phosphoribosylaminoimidazolecarboxamide formyltransferase/IMP cyclohydrolase